MFLQIINKALAVIVSISMMIPVHAANLPDLGDVGTGDLSPSAERRIGEEAMMQIRWRDALYLDDPEVEEYINQVGQRLVSASGFSRQSFEFFVIKDGTINAFAMPGGFIGVHTGLIIATESESELASVLGHEIAHVTQRHIAQMLGRQNQAGMMMLASLLVAVLAANSNSNISEAALAAGQAGALHSQLSYSRDFEREADRIGVQTLAAAGFDVRGMPSFFERLQRANRLYENNAPAYVRTHPLTGERISDMSNRVLNMPYKQVPDSDTYRFVQAKLRAQQGMPKDTVVELEQASARQPDNYALQYGLTRAFLRANMLDRAEAEYAKLHRLSPPSPFVETLGAELKMARNDAKGATTILRAAHKRFPESRSITYALADALIRTNHAAEALDLIRKVSTASTNDIQLWQLQAKAYAAQGKRTAQHRAQAEAYRLRGALSAAIEQLELARSAADGDFYELSAVDARMRELKSQMEQRQRERGAR